MYVSKIIYIIFLFLAEFDDELLALTSELLKKNADIYTLWNIRRQIIEVNTKKHDGDSDVDNVYSQQIAKSLDNELSLTKECLLNNPKSYSTWNQRFWAFQLHTSADLQNEIELCEKALGVDCRNFHCWDHRRAIVKMTKLTDRDELLFSDTLVTRNPSNYSAWHYRGTLLPVVCPSLNAEIVITEQALDEEFKKIENVCCLNSEDQTAWTYCRWLTELTSINHNLRTRVLSVSFIDTTFAIFVFSKPVNLKTVQRLIVDASSESKPVSLFKCSNANFACCHIWSLSFPNISSLSFYLELSDNSPICTIKIGENFINKDSLHEVFSIKPLCTTEEARKTLLEFIHVCEELLRMEDDNPWELIALTRTELFLNGFDFETVGKAVRNFETVKRLDPQRKEMYDELVDKLRIVAELNKPFDTEDEKTRLQKLTSSGGRGQLNLKGLGLKSIQHLTPISGLVEDLNLESNMITDLGQFRVFVLLTHLILDDNPLTTISSDFDMPQLIFLSLARTQLSIPESLNQLQNLPKLERLLLCETELAKNEEKRKVVVGLFRKNVRLIFFYT